jgi:hypothetical protein
MSISSCKASFFGDGLTLFFILLKRPCKESEVSAFNSIQLHLFPFLYNTFQFTYEYGKIQRGALLTLKAFSALEFLYKLQYYG